MKIWANCIVHNEENFIWFAIMSVINYVDKVLVYDTGSTDKTAEIVRKVREVKGSKVEFREAGLVGKEEFTKMRQKMLDESKCDWILILDGDEIWWEASIKKLVNVVNARGREIDGIVVPMVVPAGDIYHLQEERAGKYQIQRRSGHLSLKAINRKIRGLHVEKPYGMEGYFDGDNKPVQGKEKIVFLDAPFLHVTHLKRSGLKRKFDKFKYELGDKVSRDFHFPEVLRKNYPAVVKSPWTEISGIEFLAASLLTPLRKFKRRII